MEPLAPGQEQRPEDVTVFPAAPSALSARVMAALPSDWRGDVRVTRAPGGFAVELQDASGVRHVLRAHWQEGGFRALAHGRRFSLSHRAEGGAPEGDVAEALYREATGALLAEEGELAALTRPAESVAPSSSGASLPGFDLLAQPLSGEALSGWVLARLPAAWRSGARVVQAPGGFAVGFQGPSGAWHTLRAREMEEGFLVLAQARHFDFSYLTRDGEPEDAGTVARYRELIEALRADEDQLAEALYPRGVGVDLLVQPSLGEALSARVRALLLPDWREDVQVARAPGGFVVGFRDASGVRHLLRAQRIEDGFAVLTHGRHFALSHLEHDDESENSRAALRCRELAETFLRREEQLAEALRSPRHVRSIDLFAAPPTNAALSAWVDALPEEWGSDLEAVQVDDGFAVGFRDASGARHVLRGHWLEEGFPVLAHGRRVILSYLQSGGDPEDPNRLARYREVARAFLEQEEPLTEHLRPHGAPRRGRDLFAPPPVSGALAARVRVLLPPDWRGDVKAARVTDGFAVGFQDASGARHVLRAHWLEEGAPAFVQGRRFDFSYENLAESENLATVARYREVLEAFRAQEDQLAEDLSRGP